MAELATCSTRGASGRHRCGDDRGAVVVEAALVFPLILLLLLGIMDFGMLYKQEQTLIVSAQLTSRSVANLANSPTADYNAVLGARASLTSLRSSTYDYVIVYRTPQSTAGTAPDRPTVGCLAAANAASPTTVGGRIGVSGCNVYTRGMIEATSAVSPGAQFAVTGAAPGTCPVSSWHSNWCPTSRVNTQLGNGGLGPDHVGVFIQARYTPLTGITSAQTFSDYAVYRLEPIPIS